MTITRALEFPPLTDEELALIDRDAVESGVNLWATSAEVVYDHAED